MQLAATDRWHELRVKQREHYEYVVVVYYVLLAGTVLCWRQARPISPGRKQNRAAQLCFCKTLAPCSAYFAYADVLLCYL